ncbi:MAG: response regulator [Kofleriaceae bacterium]
MPPPVDAPRTRRITAAPAVPPAAATARWTAAFAAVPPPPPRILCVDDDLDVVVGMVGHLRRRWEVVVAGSGREGLEILGGPEEVACVLCDVRAGDMSGADFLAQARSLRPAATRILLSSETDLRAAMAAINEGQVFRFLTKPCAVPRVLAAVEDGIAHHRLLDSERQLLTETLCGSIEALIDVLELTSPQLFGRANRIKQLVSELALRQRLRDVWQFEVAAMLSQLGAVALPAETVARQVAGHALTDDEQRMLDRVPSTTERLLANIPRLEVVRAIIARSAQPPCGRITTLDHVRQVVEQGAQLLQLAVAFDHLIADGVPARDALAALRARGDAFAPALLEALRALRAEDDDARETQALPIFRLRVGMVVAADLRLASGALLVMRGYEITESFLARLRNLADGALRGPVLVYAR